MNIRSITYTVPIDYLAKPETSMKIQSFGKEFKEELSQINTNLRTERLSIEPITVSHQTTPEYVSSIGSKANKLTKEFGARWFCIPLDFSQQKSSPEAGKLAVDLIRLFPNCFVNILATNKGSLNLDNVDIAADIVKNVSKINGNGFDNFRLGISLNCQPNTPFFPFSYSDEKFGFSLAVETLGFMKSILLNDNLFDGSLDRFREVLLEKIVPELRTVNSIVEKLSQKHSLEFKGFDLSLAPFPGECSINDIFDVLGGQAIGGDGTTFLTAFLTDILRDIAVKAEVKTCGFNGVMFSVLEDDKLASSASQRLVNLDSLKLYSSVCGCGLDMVPVPGDIYREEISSLVYDIAALALALKKPLGVRLLPIPYMGSGQMTDFNYDFLVNSRVFEIKSSPLRNHEITDSNFSILANRYNN